jgi:hypothetical protein
VAPLTVIVVAPTRDQPPGLAEAVEDLLVEQFVPHPADEALGIGVLLGFARCDRVPFDPDPVGPREDGARRQLRPIVTDNARRRSPTGDDRIQLAGDPHTGDRRIRDRGQTLPCAVAD